MSQKLPKGFRRYDAAEHLKNDADIAAYLAASAEAAAEEGDSRILALALGNIMRARNVSALARDTGISRVGLQRALSADGNPRLETLLKVAKALGVRLSFEPAA